MRYLDPDSEEYQRLLCLAASKSANSNPNIVEAYQDTEVVPNMFLKFPEPSDTKVKPEFKDFDC